MGEASVRVYPERFGLAQADLGQEGPQDEQSSMPLKLGSEGKEARYGLADCVTTSA